MLFAVFCPSHETKVLMTEYNVTDVHNSPSGIEVHYRCSCGHEGVWETGRSRVAAA